MSRGPQKFRQNDVTKAVKGAVKGGVVVGRVEIFGDGRIVVIADTMGRGQNFGPGRQEPDEWD